MTWTGISLNGRTALFVVPGNLNGRRYIDDILRPHVVPYPRQMGHNAIFQDDNARTHRARIVANFLQLNGAQRLECPPMSPDFSCIEHLWDILGQAVNKHINQHTRLADLQRLPLQEWTAITHRQIQRLVNSLRRRLNECRVNRIIERRNCDFVIFGTQPHMASADDYSCINDDILVLTSVYCPN